MYSYVANRHLFRNAIFELFYQSLDETNKKSPDPHESLCKEVPLSSTEKADLCQSLNGKNQEKEGHIQF